MPQTTRKPKRSRAQKALAQYDAPAVELKDERAREAYAREGKTLIGRIKRQEETLPGKIIRRKVTRVSAIARGDKPYAVSQSKAIERGQENLSRAAVRKASIVAEWVDIDSDTADAWILALSDIIDKREPEKTHAERYDTLVAIRDNLPSDVRRPKAIVAYEDHVSANQPTLPEGEPT